MASIMAPTPHPTPQSLKDFTTIMERWNLDEHGEATFGHTNFLYVDKDEYTAWYGKVGTVERETSLEQAIGCLRRVPDHEVYPPSDLDMPATSTSDYELTSDTWLKRPNIIVYGQLAGCSLIADEFRREIMTYRRLQQHPHPNVVQFKGCLQKGSLIVGVLLKRYPITLDLHKYKCDETFDRQACLDGIQAGVYHLHSLGIAHNDLNPDNIMLDEEGRPIIIDLGASKPFGEVLVQGGTPGWNDGFSHHSSKANDEIGLRKIREWLL